MPYIDDLVADKPVLRKVVDWLDDRLDIKGPIDYQLNKNVYAPTITWTNCFGGISFTLFGVQVLTGILLAFYYQPGSDTSYESIKYIMDTVHLGWLIRSIHAWSANLLIGTVFFHMARVYFAGAYKPPREFNWIVGIVLLVLTILIAFTGYLLPWNQLAYWASQVGTHIAGTPPLAGPYVEYFLKGGEDLTTATINRFYALHMLVLPVLIAVMIGAHLLMIRRQGPSGGL